MSKHAQTQHAPAHYDWLIDEIGRHGFDDEFWQEVRDAILSALEARSDVRDGEGGRQVPNAAMSALQSFDQEFPAFLWRQHLRERLVESGAPLSGFSNPCGEHGEDVLDLDCPECEVRPVREASAP
jgi:hypothetical protein